MGVELSQHISCPIWVQHSKSCVHVSYLFIAITLTPKNRNNYFYSYTTTFERYVSRLLARDRKGVYSCFQKFKCYKVIIRGFFFWLPKCKTHCLSFAFFSFQLSKFAFCYFNPLSFKQTQFNHLFTIRQIALLTNPNNVVLLFQLIFNFFLFLNFRNR